MKPNLIEIVADLVPLETTLKTITAPQNQPVCLLHPLMGRPPNKLADKLPQIDLFLFCAPIQFEAIYILCYAFLTPFLAPLLIPPPPPETRCVIHVDGPFPVKQNEWSTFVVDCSFAQESHSKPTIYLSQEIESRWMRKKLAAGRFVQHLKPR